MSTTQHVRDRNLDDRCFDIAVGTVRGQKSRFENVLDVKESNITFGTFIESPDKENRNR